MTTLTMTDYRPGDERVINPEPEHLPWYRRQERITQRPTRAELLARWRTLMDRQDSGR
jgi:hypothetical protein